MRAAGRTTRVGTLLFVYGTLKRGQRSHGLLRGQEFVADAETAPGYRLYDQGRYPCLVEDPQRGVAVQGELWRVEAAALARLDAYEGAPDLFERREVQVRGVREPVRAYFYRGDVRGFRDCGGSWPVTGPPASAG